MVKKACCCQRHLFWNPTRKEIIGYAETAYEESRPTRRRFPAKHGLDPVNVWGTQTLKLVGTDNQIMGISEDARIYWEVVIQCEIILALPTALQNFTS